MRFPRFRLPRLPLPILILLLGLGPPAVAADQLGSWKAYSDAGQAAPALALAGMDGRELDLAAARGRVVLVNFWATWCEPCRQEMPALSRLERRLGARGFQVLAVNVGEGRARIRQFLAAHPVEFAVARDEDSVAMKAWRVRVLPSSFLIDRNGMLRYQLVGEADWDDARVTAPIVELLKQGGTIGGIHSAGAGR